MDAVNLGIISEIFNLTRNRTAESVKLEGSFTEQDRMLILLYFRWLTRSGARDLGITHLEKSHEMTDATRVWLKERGLEKVDDWEFTGMIDHGSTSSGITCSHGGHRLRYAYYATSPSTGVELIFGQSCGSEFFQVDLGLMKKLTKVLDTAKEELCDSFKLGRSSIVMAYSTAVTMAQVMRRDRVLCELCYRYAGRTQLELWLNFVNRGIMPPKTLTSRMEQAYKLAMAERLRGLDTAVDLEQAYSTLAMNEAVPQDTEILQNKGIVSKGEFIFPLTRETLFNQIRICCAEELFEPSPLSTYYDIYSFLAKIDELERRVDELDVPTVSRARVIHQYFENKGKGVFYDTLSCLVWAVLTNDARYVTLFMGLSPQQTMNCFKKCWESGSSKFNYRLFMPRLSKRRLFVLLWLCYYDEVLLNLESAANTDIVEVISSSTYDVENVSVNDEIVLEGDLEFEIDEDDLDWDEDEEDDDEEDEDKNELDGGDLLSRLQGVASSGDNTEVAGNALLNLLKSGASTNSNDDLDEFEDLGDLFEEDDEV